MTVEERAREWLLSEGRKGVERISIGVRGGESPLQVWEALAARLEDALRAAAAEARREMGEEAAEAVESYEKWHGVNLTTLAHVIREVAKDPEAPASSPSATRPEGEK